MFFATTLFLCLLTSVQSSFNESENAERRVLAVAPSSLCVELIYKESALNFAYHPASRSYALIANQQGLIQLVNLPAVGSRKKMTVVSTWLDLRPRVRFYNEQGLLSILFHPNFLNNGRFYVSYICDGNKHKDCRGPCACNPSVGCTIGSYGASCFLNTIIAEYSITNPRNAFSKPGRTESRRLFKYARPFANHNGGALFFGRDGYLYITSGDGGNQGDPFNFAQNGKTFLGKILRIDLGKRAGGKNYSIPPSNPFVGDKRYLPEVYALGLRNPWRCSVDSANGNIFCGDVGNLKVEEIDRIYPGGNYGWPKYEGTTTFKPSAKITLGKKLWPPVFQYAHNYQNIPGIPVVGNSIIGGYVYRSARNKCLQGKYLYNDWLGIFFAGTVYPGAGKKPYTTRLKTRCASTSPFKCDVYGGQVSFGVAWGWGADVNKDLYILSSNGVFRIVDSKFCGVTC